MHNLTFTYFDDSDNNSDTNYLSPAHKHTVNDNNDNNDNNSDTDYLLPTCEYTDNNSNDTNYVLPATETPQLVNELYLEKFYIDIKDKEKEKTIIEKFIKIECEKYYTQKYDLEKQIKRYNQTIKKKFTCIKRRM